MLARLICLTISVLLAVPAAAAEFQDDLKARRARVMERLAPESMLILRSAPVKTYSNDVEYEFRQDSNFYYLTGIDQPDSILVLMPGNRERKEILFVLPANPVREHWEGHILTPREATEASGITTVRLTSDFERFLAAMLSRTAEGGAREDSQTFFTALDNNRAKVALLLGPPPALGAEIPEPYRFVNRLRERYDGFTALDATPILDGLRHVKTPYELKVMEESARISSDAHMAGMRAATPGAFEYEVEAAIEYVYKKNGAFDWGYPSIVGSGPNATVLHYNASSRQMKDGDLLLVDAAASYKYITVDITRTYPVNGRFTAAQRDLYNLVYQAQEEAQKVAKPGVRIRQVVHQKTVDVIKQGLLKLGLITDASGDQYRIWYTHGSTHWIGMDVHDVGDYERLLEPGMTFVIEPGIYIRESALDNLPKTAENAAFIERVRPAVQKYKDIGVRLEDSFILTATGLKNLSASVPRTVEEIEAFMRSGAPASR